MIKIEHLALWVNDLEGMRAFYQQWFSATANAMYHNEKKQFRSYFITFGEGARLELMQRPDVEDTIAPGAEFRGLTHFAIQLGSEAAVDEMTGRMQAAGLSVVGPPRRTGDGYYESVVLVPEGNRLELMA